MNRFIAAVIWGIVKATMVCKTSGNPFQIIAIAAVLMMGSTSGYAAGPTVYPTDASGNAIAVDRQVKAEIRKTKCMFVDAETGKCTMQSVYNGGGDGGSGGAGAGSAGGSSGSAGGSSGSAGAGGGSGSGGGSSGGGSGGGSGAGGGSGGGGSGGGSGGSGGGSGGCK